jgi:hypothetical protein
VELVGGMDISRGRGRRMEHGRDGRRESGRGTRRGQWAARPRTGSVPEQRRAAH